MTLFPVADLILACGGYLIYEFGRNKEVFGGPHAGPYIPVVYIYKYAATYSFAI